MRGRYKLYGYATNRAVKTVTCFPLTGRLTRVLLVLVEPTCKGLRRLTGVLLEVINSIEAMVSSKPTKHQTSPMNPIQKYT